MGNLEWNREKTRLYNIRYTYSSGIPQAIEECAEKEGITGTQLIKQAVDEHLMENRIYPEKYRVNNK